MTSPQETLADRLARWLSTVDAPTNKTGQACREERMQRIEYLGDKVYQNKDAMLAALRSTPASGEIREPTEAMLRAARDWSCEKYGKPIGNDAAMGCWRAMFDAARTPSGETREEAGS